jgi:uncharacterized protein involved in tolerance to divalent cations
MNEMQKYENSVKRVDVINEFISVFAQQGVVFTDEEIEIIFNRYATKFKNLVEHIDKGETK